MRNVYALGMVGLLLFGSWVQAQDWPQWRGPNRDNKVTGFTEPKTWPKELTQKWKETVGTGDAWPVLVGDKVYVFTRQGGDEVILCLNAADGKEVWKDKYASTAVSGPGGGHPGPRATPAVAEGKICTLGVAGILSCLDAATGKVVWRKDTKAWPMFFTASSPIIVDGRCVAFLGGRGGKNELAAFDLNTGEAKWQWTKEGPAYGSPVLLTVDGSKQIVTLTDRSLVAVGADDGKQLWQASFAARYNSATPVVVGQTVICSESGGMRPGGGGGGGGGRGGTAAFKIEKKDNEFTAKELWRKEQGSGIYNTPVLKDGLLYGFTGGNRTQGVFFCMNAETGETLWTDTTRRGECGAILDTGTVLLGLTSDSQLVAFKPSKKGYEEVAKYKVSESPTWAAPIIAGNRVFAKGRDTLTLWTIE